MTPKRYLSGTFDMESLVENLLHKLVYKLQIKVNIYDTTNETNHVLMYGLGSRCSSGYHVSDKDFGGSFRKREMHCRHSEEPKSPLLAILTHSGIFVIVLLQGHIFHAAMTRLVTIKKYSKELEELKGRTESAHVAKSQGVRSDNGSVVYYTYGFGYPQNPYNSYISGAPMMGGDAPHESKTSIFSRSLATIPYKWFFPTTNTVGTLLYFMSESDFPSKNLT